MSLRLCAVQNRARPLLSTSPWLYWSRLNLVSESEVATLGLLTSAAGCLPFRIQVRSMPPRSLTGRTFEERIHNNIDIDTHIRMP